MKIRVGLTAVAALLFGNQLLAESPLPENFVLERLDSGYGLTEGPLWHYGYLYFCDVGGGTVYRWQPDEPTSVAVRPSGNCSGLALSDNKQLVMAQQGARRIARLNDDGTQTVLASHYDGKRLNQPNDMAVHKDGSIYFTDPALGLNASERELGFTGIYRISPSGELQLLDATVSQPNGITFGPDFQTLYVSNSFDREVIVFDVKGHRLSNQQIFARLEADAGAADGMLTDSHGNLFVAGPGGVWIFNTSGEPLGKIRIPGLQTTNLAWTGSQQANLMITAMDAIYRIQWKPLSPAATAPAYQAALESYAGTYQLVTGDTVEITGNQGQLYLQGSEKETRLFPEPGNVFHADELNLKFEFKRHPNGETTGLLLHQDGFKIPAEKLPARLDPG